MRPFLSSVQVPAKVHGTGFRRLRLQIGSRWATSRMRLDKACCVDGAGFADHIFAGQGSLRYVLVRNHLQWGPNHSRIRQRNES